MLTKQVEETKSPRPTDNESDLSPTSGFIDLGYRPSFVYRLNTAEVIMVNGEEHQFCFLAYKNFKLSHLAKVKNPAKKAMLCACESNDHLFIVTQESHIFIISKTNFTLAKSY